MLIRHRQIISFPDLAKVRDEVARSAFQDLCRIIGDMSMNLLDDIKNLEDFERVDALPTAGIDYHGKAFLKQNAGALDTLHVCVYNGASSSYVWKQITLS
jgi:hypothetical protein